MLKSEYKNSAFSIAEALMTMLIVALIMIMTMPIITHKFQKGTGISGSWKCTYNPVSGNYIVESEGAPSGTSPDGCTFTPPAGARNFTVNAIGGGGGGASATVGLETFAKSFKGTYNYVPPIKGFYTITAIGGGGSGGKGRDLGDPCRRSAGAAGGIASYDKFELQKDATYTVVVGAGASFAGDVWKGGSGEPSFVLKPSATDLIRATGGSWGRGGWGVNCKYHDGWTGKGGSGGSYNVRGEAPDVATDNTREGGKTCNDGRCGALDVTRIGNLAYSSVGKGGNATPVRQNGSDGAVVIKFSGLISGGGGKSGVHVFKTFKKLPPEVKVTIGVGGGGAVLENRDGGAGGVTSFGNLLVAGGGSGGEAQLYSGPATTPLPGGNGGDSPLGAGFLGGINNGGVDGEGAIFTSMDQFLSTRYGAGGGGGGAKDKKACVPTNGYSGCWGRGGNGAGGVVWIDWN